MGCHIGWDDFINLPVRLIEDFQRLAISQGDVNEEAILKSQGKTKL